MRVILKNDLLVIAPTSDNDRADIERWKSRHPGHHFQSVQDCGRGLVLKNLGDPRLSQPINVTSRHPDPEIQLIGNFAATPFVLDATHFASVESFWQSLRCDSELERLKVASLAGIDAKRASKHLPNNDAVRHLGEIVPTGSFRHWELMARACAAKFDQNENARRALLSTWPHPLMHRPKRDSVTIPGDVLARIWLGIRANEQRRQLSTGIARE